MNLIHKNTYEYLIDFQSNQSIKSPNEWAIIPENISTDIESKYIATINYEVEKQEFVNYLGEKTGEFYDVVSEIIEMTPEEKAVVDKFEADNAMKDLFFGKNIRISGNIKLLDTNPALNKLYLRVLGQDSVKVTSKDVPELLPNDKIKKLETFFYIHTNMLNIADYDDIKNIPELIKEVYNGGSLTDTDAEGNFLYLIPQNEDANLIVG